MAQVKNNIVTLGLSGKFANQIVFRQRDGKTIVSAMPQMPEERSEAQKQQSNKFREAVKYAKYVLHTAALLATYTERAKEGKTPYHLAISDYLKPPVIGEVALHMDDKSENIQIRIKASDDHLIAEVLVTLYDSDHTLLEQGQAWIMKNENEWVYSLLNIESKHSDHYLRIRVADLPGNIIEKEVALP